MEMDSPKADEEGSGISYAKNEELVKNSVIAVTVDDLNEGLIVVSYSHHDNLYQGVLLQLNRERGIPSGISFPKDYCTGSVAEPLGENNDPSQVPPLPQRHTYFQDKEGTLADPAKARLSLRRVIKPPARFKNARMSLRLRHRPVLCAKCRTLCEELAPPKPPKEPPQPPDDTVDTSKKPLAGVTTRRSRSAEMGNPTAQSIIPPPETDPSQDYSFTSIGSKGIVENYWKRPSPLLEEKERKAGLVPANGSKDSAKVPRLSKILSWDETGSGGGGIGGGGTETKDGSRVILPRPFDKTVRAKKSKNIKLCISKVNCENLPKLSPMTDSAENRLPDLDDDGMKDAKMWENRIRKKSTVPVRFRDEGYVTKNIFNFKRRRDESPEEDGMPDLTSRFSPDQVIVTELDEVNPPKLSKSSSPELSPSEQVTPQVPSVGSESLDGKSSSSSSEPAKTPVIKISFGTPGNGVVIQIPPKAKQEDPAASTAVVVASGSTDKAVRKALKKAKKEARRKLSLSRETSPTRNPSPGAGLLVQSVSCDESKITAEPLLLDPLIPPKKKKKEKKKKREKDLKENGSLSHENHDVSNGLPIIESYEQISPTTVDQQPAGSPEAILPSESDSKSGFENGNSSPDPDAPPPPTRLCISLKRLNEDSMGWDITSQQNCRNNCQNTSNSELESGEPDQAESSPVHLEPSDFDASETLLDEATGNAASLDTYTDVERKYVYKKGDIIWGKLPGCPWWPGKILDILCIGEDDVSARVSWYRASTLSCVRFSQLSPFAEQFEARYTRSRKRGSYQHAVRDALIEAHQLDPNDLPRCVFYKQIEAHHDHDHHRRRSGQQI